VGDLLWFKYKGDVLERAVTAKASNDSVTVDTAIDLGTDGVYFQYKTMFAGADTEDGYVPIANMQSIAYTVNIAQMNGTGGIDMHVQCRQQGGPPVILLTDNSTAAEILVFSLDFETGGPFDQCRIGFKWGTADDAVDTTTLQERITVVFEGIMRQIP